MRVEFAGDRLIVTDDDQESVIVVQLTPTIDTETGAIVWHDNKVIGGLYRNQELEFK